MLGNVDSMEKIVVCVEAFTVDGVKTSFFYDVLKFFGVEIMAPATCWSKKCHIAAVCTSELKYVD